jgi:serine/threonine protein kinase
VYLDEKPKPDSKVPMKIRRAAITPETTISSEDVVDGEEAFGFVVNFHVENMPEWHFRAASEEERENWLIKLNQAHAISKWLNEYQRVKILGIGGQGIVYELLHTSTGRHWAMKEIEIKSERQMAAAVAEAQFLKRIVEKVAHPNILHIEKVFQVGSKFFMVFPLCTGGELYDAVVSKGHFTEHDAAKIFREIMGALEALHDQNILHLDIKPENILLESREPDAKVFVTDFGLSKFSSDLAKQPPFNEKDFVEKRTRCMFHHEISMEHVRGTYGYMSPEVILLGYSSAAADVFAAGVVLYILLCGYPPFHHRSHREKLIATVSGSYRLEGEEWDFISDEAKDLLRRMLETNPLQRITAKEVMAHPWVVNIDDADFPFAVKSMSSLASTSHDEATTKAAVEDTLKALKLSAPATINSTTSTVKTVSSGSRHTNLSAAVHNLASHVQSLKSERMAATITKLMSAGGKAAGYSHLAEQYLYTLKAAGGGAAAHGANGGHGGGGAGVPGAAAGRGGGGGGGGDHSGAAAPLGTLAAASPAAADDHESNPYSMHQMLMMVDKEIRHALARAIFRYFGTNGTLSIDQFLTLRKNFGFQSGLPGATGSFLNAGDIVLVQMIDRDGDGSISLEDMMSTFVGVNQLQESYLRIIFRIYTEAQWYFGQHLNYRHAMQQWHNQAKEYQQLQQQQQQQQQQHPPQQHQQQQQQQPPLQSAAAAGGGISSPDPKLLSETNSIAVEEGSAGVKALVNRTVINPPRYITAKHVSAIFEQLGYDPVAGAKVFEVLCEALQRIRHPNGRNNFDDEISAPILEEDAEDDEDGGDDEHVHAGTAAGGTAATAASATATATGAAATAAHGSDIPPPAPPSASKKGALHHDEAHELQALASTQATVGSDIAETSITSSAKAKISFGRPFRLRPAQPTTRIAQMDVNDFIRAAHIDNVLVQVFFRQTHAKIYELIQRARRRVVEEQRAQAALPPEQRKEVSIERIFEEDIARIFDNQ